MSGTGGIIPAGYKWIYFINIKWELEKMQLNCEVNECLILHIWYSIFNVMTNN